MTCHKDDLVFREVDAPKKEFKHDMIAYKVTYQKEGKMMIFERVEILLDTVPQKAVSTEHGAAAEFSADSGDQSSERLGGDDVKQYTAEKVKHASTIRRRLGRSALLEETYGASS